MNANADRKRARLATIALGLLAVLTVGLFLGAGMPPIQVGPVQHGGIPASAGLRPDVIANTQIYLNRSQSSGTYVKEYVTLNNSTTLTA
ncbi:MAG TPA: hypothetical protein VGS23_07285, partial [Thermoplasmata archaeon]|nr:hypothetical protein [Thermoplasmata archaeon]